MSTVPDRESATEALRERWCTASNSDAGRFVGHLRGDSKPGFF
jgi:hypothetical protein